MTNIILQKQRAALTVPPAPVPTYENIENIDPLCQSSVQTAPSYENIPAVAFSPQSSNIEMKECPAYGVINRT